MRIPLNWLKEFVNLPKSEKDLTDSLTLAGHMLDKIEKVNENTVVDLELRGNRADCYSVMGIAREVSALFNTPLKENKLSKLKTVKKLSGLNLQIKTELVKRVMMVKIKNIKVMDSPKWLKEKLEAYGTPSINNIVDLTNYVMIETGQPMHAFDLEKIGKNLEIRLAKTGEQMITFLGKKETLGNKDLVWTNKDAVLSIAGAIGGKLHSISNSTKNVLLEAASYDRANIRRSIHKHSLFTEAGIRHEKDLDPNLVETGISRFLELLEKNKWGVADKKIYDYYSKPIKPWGLTLNYEYLENLGGVLLEPKLIQNILKSLGFEIVKVDKEKVEVLVPTYRTDVKLEEDLIEEVLRVYGYDKIPTQTLSLAIPPVVTPKFIDQELSIKNIMVGLGFDEIISSSFVKENYIDHNKDLSGNFSSVKVENKPSPDNEVLRMTLFPNLFEITQRILNERGTESYLFEVGKVYLKSKSDYIEKRKLGILYHQKNGEFVYFKGFVESLFEKLNLDEVKLDSSEFGFEIRIGKEHVGSGFEMQNIYFLEIDLDLVLGKEHARKATLWPKYPPQIEDHTFTFPERTKVGEVITAIRLVDNQVNKVELIDTYKNSYTVRVNYQNPTKTLTDSEVESIREKILKLVKEKFGGSVKD